MPEIIELSIAHTLTDFYPKTIYDIITWCREYERVTKFPVTIERRFGIGFYQISQGYNWKDGGVNKYEGYAAAVCHFFMVAERLGLCIDSGLDIKLDEFLEYDLNGRTGLDLLIALSEAQQHVIYGVKTYRAKSRASRYNPQRLTLKLGKAIYILISCIPKDLRYDAFQKASEIMTKDLK